MPADAAAWLGFAAADLDAARVLLADPGIPPRLACFHAQQAAEKALKAALVAEAIPFRKTHDLVVLVGLAPASLAAELSGVDVLVLQPWAVDGRYPGDVTDATELEARDVIAVAEAILAVVRRHVGATMEP